MSDKTISAADLKTLEKIMKDTKTTVDASTLKIVMEAAKDRTGKK